MSLLQENHITTDLTVKPPLELNEQVGIFHRDIPTGGKQKQKHSVANQMSVAKNSSLNW